MLKLEVLDDEIIVTLPYAHYTVTYYKPAKSPQLLAKRFQGKDDPRPHDTCGLPGPRLEARQRQGARAGVDCVTGRPHAGPIARGSWPQPGLATAAAARSISRTGSLQSPIVA